MKYIDIKPELVWSQTDKAVKVLHNESMIWLPKSQVETEQKQTYSETYVVAIADWLYRKYYIDD